jgi:hypothetical protein
MLNTNDLKRSEKTRKKLKNTRFLGKFVSGKRKFPGLTAEARAGIAKTEGRKEGQEMLNRGWHG